VRPTRIFHLLAGVSARRLRGLSLLASLLLVLVVSPLAALSVLPWWSVLVVVAVLGADVAWLRQVALSLRAADPAPALAGGSAPRRARPAARDTVYFGDGSEPMFEGESEAESLAGSDAEADLLARSEPDDRAEPEHKGGPLFSSDSDTLVMAHPRFWAQPDSEPEPEPETEHEHEHAGGSDSEPDSVDETPVPRAAELVEPTVAFARADLSGWAPVPVPPPTYTLKAKAPEPVLAPVLAPVVTEPAETGPWSLDGLVYDCELDDLVEGHRAAGA
jgi:hypothetical protein